MASLSAFPEPSLTGGADIVVEQLPAAPPPSERPSGMVTFLFTDIQGSTKLWERHPELMARALARHDQLMRQAIARHRGYVFKTVGDAFCVAFPSANDGLEAAVDAQRALFAEPWPAETVIRVRMALHTGEPELRDNDYFGPPVNRVARLLAAGHGGQVLLSSNTERDLDPHTIPPGITLRDMGLHRLKDLAHREQVYQVLAPDLPAIFPKLKAPPRPLTGIVLSVLFWLLTILAAQVFFTRSLNPANFLPWEVYGNFKGTLIRLSAIRDLVLLGLAAAFIVLTVAAVWVWKRMTELRPGARIHGAVEFAGNFTNPRSIAFLGTSVAVILGAFLYQQYQWHVQLPIDDDAIGIALTQEASAATVADDLADRLFQQGQTERIVIRQLPVRFDASDVDEARRIGARINARSVVIYREDDSREPTQYRAYVVFTDPAVGLQVAATPQTAGNEGVQQYVLREGVPVPALRTDTLEELISAAAGIIAYNEGQTSEAIQLLENALPGEPDAANTGIVNFYLAAAYEQDGQSDDAVAAFEHAIAYYEGRRAGGSKLGPQDLLLLAKSYFGRGRVEQYDGRPENALGWYQKAVALREELLEQAGNLERPSDVHATYAWMYGEMAVLYRLQERPEDVRFWETRAREEADAIASAGDPDDPQVALQRTAALYFIGDCVGAMAAAEHAHARDPEETDALQDMAIIAYSQGRPDVARQHLVQLLRIEPNHMTARELLVTLAWIDALSSREYVELSYLDEAERLLRETLQLRPADVWAHEELAQIASFRTSLALLDATAAVSGDNVAVVKSQTSWPADPARRQQAFEQYDALIQEYRILTTELRPGDYDLQLALAGAYLERQGLVYDTLSSRFGQPTTPELEADGARVVADADQIREWTAPVLDARSTASRAQRLRAYDILLSSYDREWSWHFFFADQTRAAELAATAIALGDEALAAVEAAPLSGYDELIHGAAIYSDRAAIALLLEQDQERAAELYAKFFELSASANEGLGESTAVYDTICNEARATRDADAQLAAGDAQGALVGYNTALGLNASYVPAILGMAAASYSTGDAAAALGYASAATEVTPDDPRVWSKLALYATASGDAPRRDDALNRFFDLVAGKPGQERFALLRRAVADFRELATTCPEQATAVAAVLPRFTTAIDALGAASPDASQYPALYADLGGAQLFAGDAAGAEATLRQALALDPRLPLAHLHLALAAVAQGRAGAAELAALTAELDSELWAETDGVESFGRTELIAAMNAEIEAYRSRFPELVVQVEAIRAGLAEADQ